MGEQVGIVCHLLSQSKTLDQTAFKTLCKNKQHKLNEQTLIELITTLFIQAVGCEKLSTIDPLTAFPLTRNSQFLQELKKQHKLICIVANQVLAKKNPIECQELWQALAPKGYGGASNRTQRVAQWTKWGIESMSYPAFRMLEHGYPENVVKHANAHEEKVNEMAIFLYEYLEAPQEGNHLSFSLLMVHRIIALTTQLVPVTWGSLLAAYADHFPGKKERVDALLTHYPFQNLVNPLYIPCPITCRLTLETNFRDFVIYMTLYSMESFLGHDVSKQAADKLKPALAHEPFRRTFSLFISQPKWPLYDLNEHPYFAKEEMDLLLDYRMAYHFVHFHTASESRGSLAGEAILEWALCSDRNAVMHIDKKDYSGTTPQILCDPKELVPNVFSLAPIYDNDGADFNTCAFSLLLLLTTMQEKKDPFITFLLACHTFPLLSITHHQILQYSHHNEAIETTADLAFLEALQKSAPPTLNGTSSAFFNLFLIKDLKPELRLEKLQTFNEQFPFSSAGTLSADLYAKALYFFVTDKITIHHIHILKLYQDDYPDLTLRYKLDLLIRIAQEEKPRQFVLETDIDPTLNPLTHLDSHKKYLDIQVCEKFSALFPLLQSKFQEPDKLQPYLISLLRTTLTVEKLDALIKNIESSPHKISESEL
ncbi:MAG: hypothetical protein KDK71_06605, partial [Chlamydiia bacterium]|nr:hypothetical protein [Chlamydiia bacterium]